MAYQPDLIPPENRVLPDYFNARQERSGGKGKKPGLPEVFCCILFFGLAVLSYQRPMIAVLLAACGFILTGQGKRWLERQGRFTLTVKISALFCGSLLLLCLPLYAYYAQKAEDDLLAEQAAGRRAAAFTADSLARENIRRDSLSACLKGRPAELSIHAIRQLSRGARFAVTAAEKADLRKAVGQLTLLVVNNLMEQGKYDQAMPVIEMGLKDGTGGPALLYQRGLCHLKAGHTGLAVGDLDSAMRAGFRPALELYNKVNPVRKRIAYYETLCSDGSSSSATGRGACSWHGGVAQWNHPVYEEYRKY